MTQQTTLLIPLVLIMALTDTTIPSQKAPTAVQANGELSAQERDYRAKRLPIAKKKLEALIGTTLRDEQVPTIAFACSGGGFRAMYATLGMLEGAQTIGLLDATTYLACLSGSTWLTFPWIVDGRPITLYKDHVLRTGRKGFFRTARDMTKALAKVARHNLSHGFKENIMDGYGYFLSKRLFSKDKRDLAEKPFSALAEHPQLHAYPLPIGTAAYPCHKREYHWMEFTPFQVAGEHIGCAIDTTHLGSTFKDGTLAKAGKEPTLGYMLGVFGSAFSMSMRDIVEHAPNRVEELENLKNYRWYNRMHTIAKRSRIANHKLAAAHLPNFAYGVEDSPMHDRKQLTLVDGGFITDLPIVPLLCKKRGVDVIFVLDSHREKKPSATMLRLAENDARARGLPFPPIDYKQATTQSLSIFRDSDNSKCPTIVYIPLRKNENYNDRCDPMSEAVYNTVNFTYRKKQAEMLAGLPAHVLIQNRSLIKELLADIAKNKGAK